MYPVLLKLGPLTIYSFGFMMAMAFLIANYLFAKELRNRGYKDEVGSTITLIALIAGISGSKLFHILENPQLLISDPMGAIFSGDGLTFYGGLILSIVLIFVYCKSKGYRFLDIADSASPALILAYGIGRIGCQLAGDGDYGIPSFVPWAMGYPKGAVSTIADYNPELKLKFMELFPDKQIPYDIAVHPTPVYETLTCLLIFFLLMKLRPKARNKIGWMFGVYLVCAGIERFLVEFLRLNELYAGLSQAQWISLGLILLGIYLNRKAENSQILTSKSSSL